MEGNLNDMTLEGRSIQSRLPKFNSFMANQNLSRSFANFMFAGKIKAALNLSSQAQKGGGLYLKYPFDPNNPDSLTVRDTIKHPQGQYALLNASSLPPRKMYTWSYSSQLMPCNASFPLLCRLPSQQNPLVMMRTNGDACALPLRVHLLTCATHLPWWQKALYILRGPQMCFSPPFLPHDCPE